MSTNIVVENTNNLAQPTNFMCGSGSLEFTEKYCTSLTIPGMTMNHPFLTSGLGGALNLQGDNVMLNSISLSLIIDENFNIYFEFMNKINAGVNMENGTFNDIVFDFFIEINNSKGNPIFKINLIDARVQSIGDIILDTTDTNTEMLLPIELVFNRMDFTKIGDKLPILSL